MGRLPTKEEELLEKAFSDFFIRTLDTALESTVSFEMIYNKRFEKLDENILSPGDATDRKVLLIRIATPEFFSRAIRYNIQLKAFLPR
jgi:hypothetical protein